MIRITAIVLGFLLVITNGAWLYAYLDQAVSLAYRDDSVRGHCNALKTCMALVPHIATGQKRQQVLSAARAVVLDGEEFEKDGAVWLGPLGLRFADERLAEVLPGWEPFDCPE